LRVTFSLIVRADFGRRSPSVPSIAVMPPAPFSGISSTLMNSALYGMFFPPDRCGSTYAHSSRTPGERLTH